MGREVEIKFRIKDPRVLEARLRGLGARYEGTVHEQNALFDAPDRRFARTDRALRIRTARALDAPAKARATITWKGARRAGPYKDREEWESEISSVEALRAILAELELAPVLEFEKRRSTWRWNEVEIVIDTIEGLGAFLEIEGAAPAIERAIDALDLRDPALGAAVEERSYPELLRSEPPA